MATQKPEFYASIPYKIETKYKKRRWACSCGAKGQWEAAAHPVKAWMQHVSRSSAHADQTSITGWKIRT